MKKILIILFFLFSALESKAAFAPISWLNITNFLVDTNTGIISITNLQNNSYGNGAISTGKVDTIFYTLLSTIQSTNGLAGTNYVITVVQQGTNGFTTIVYTNPAIFYTTNNPAGYVTASITNGYGKVNDVTNTGGGLSFINTSNVAIIILKSITNLSSYLSIVDNSTNLQFNLSLGFTNGFAGTEYVQTATNGFVRQLQVNNASNSLYITVEADIVNATNAGNIFYLPSSNIATGTSNRFTGAIGANNITANGISVTNGFTNTSLTASRVKVSGASKEELSASASITEVNHLVGQTVDTDTLAPTNTPTLYTPVLLSAAAAVLNYVWTSTGTSGAGQWQVAPSGSGVTNNGNVYAMTNWWSTFTNAIQYGIYTNSSQFSGTGNTNIIITLTNNTYYAIPLNLTNDCNFIQTTNRTAGQVIQFKYYIYPNGTNRNISVNTSWHIQGLSTTTVLQSTNIGVLMGEFNGLGTSETNVFGSYTIY